MSVGRYVCLGTKCVGGKKEAKKTTTTVGAEKRKANRASETEGRRKERLRIRRDNKKTESYEKQR